MGAGLVPNVPISSLVEKVSSWSPAREAPDDELAYIDLSSVDNQLKAVTQNQEVLGCEAPSRARQRVLAGDILVSTVRPNLNGVARVPHHLDGATASTGFCVLRPRPSKLDPSYLFHWVMSDYFIEDMVRKATGASYPAVSDKIIFNSEIPLPPLEEQKRVAAILDQADDLRRKRQHAIDRLNQLGQAIFYEMFGDPFVLQGATESVVLKSLINRITYGFTSPMSHHGAGIPILTAKSVQDGYIDYSTCSFAIREEFDKLTDKCKPDKGDILVTKDGTIGRCSIFDGGTACINQSVCLIKPNYDLVTSTFLASYIRFSSVQKRIDAMKKGNAIAHLQITEFAQFPIVCPPMERQKEFEYRLGLLENTASYAVSGLQGAHSLFASLQHRAFTGQL